MSGQTLFEKIWTAHEVVRETPDTPAVLYIDLHLVHEVSSPQAFEILRRQGLRVRRPDRTLATLDHATPTDAAELSGQIPFRNPAAAAQVRLLEENSRHNGITLFGLRDARRGIVHVVGPELGLTQPGMTIVCGDSHTSTHGAFGALAFGIGSTEVAHVLATQCILQRKPRTLAVNVEGQLSPGVSAKDLILGIIQVVGVSGGTGQVIEYRGSTIASLSMEQRMTVCNMSIEAGARSGLIAPDEVTFAYLKGRPHAPAEPRWSSSVEVWRCLRSDPDARFDRAVSIDASSLAPMITYGTNPGMVMPIGAQIPAQANAPDVARALEYMGLAPGETLLGKPIQVVFIGSCTNGRLQDLQEAARILRGRQVAPGVRLLIVPGSQQVKRAAEQAGLADVFRAAGAEWRESGCSMCIGMNGDQVPSGLYCLSTTNRNFEGRQGSGARTLLASPITAAASAVAGRIADPRDMSR